MKIEKKSDNVLKVCFLYLWLEIRLYDAAYIYSDIWYSGLQCHRERSWSKTESWISLKNNLKKNMKCGDHSCSILINTEPWPLSLNLMETQITP